jgi:hypothetical protein
MLRNLIALTALCAPLAAEQGPTRDPWLWPFASDSIWNVPIGDGADYQSEGHFKAEGTIGADVEFHYRLSEKAPKRKLFEPNGWPVVDGKRGKFFRDFPIDDDIVVRTHISNNVAAFVLADGTVEQLGPFIRMHPAGDVVGIPNPFSQGIDLRGPGIIGGHWGSGMSSFGGSLRHGELTGDEPIRHALKIDVQGKKYLHYDPSDKTKGFRWPATNCDGYADNPVNGGYGGSDPRIEMGALLAIHPRHTAASLGLTTKPAKKILQALQDYGAYIVDDAGSDSYWFCPSYEANGEFREVFGYPMDQHPGAKGPGKEWYDDVMRLVRVLSVVDNNRADNVGGGGKRRAPPVPALGAIGTTPPSIPGNPTITAVGPTSVTLRWEKSRDDVRVMTYRVYAEGRDEPVAETFGKCQVEVTGLRPSTDYRLKVQAIDTGWNRSAASVVVRAKTAAVLPGTILEDFDSGTAEGWNLQVAAVRSGRLELANWGGDTSAFCTGTKLSPGFTFSAHIEAIGGAAGNVGRILLRHHDERSHVAIEFGGGAEGPITLHEVIDGHKKTLATATGWHAQRFTVTCTPAGAISLVLTRDGQDRTVFSGIATKVPAGGHIGFQTSSNTVNIDDVRVIPAQSAP